MAELPTINLALYAQTDVGMVRSGNEDNFLILDLSTGRSWTASEEEPLELLTYSQGWYGSLLAVSDGMGGALAGEVASRMAVETVRDRMLQLQAHDVYGKMPFSERMRLAIEEANQLIHGDGQTNPAHKGLGATFTAIASQSNQIYFAQVGDSRAYLIRHGKIYRITKDQSLVQQLIDAGQITEEEAETHSYRNVILQALGAHSNVNVEVKALPLCQLDTLVICSDGLSGKMHQSEIAQIVNEADNFQSACQKLIDLANSRGGEDNITVVVAQFSGAGLSQPAPDSVEPQNLARSPDTPTEINWGMGAPTDPLPNSLEDAQPHDASGDPNAQTTLPLQGPPKEATPFTAKIPRKAPDLPRTNDLSDRRGPITSVFGPEEFEGAPPAAPAKEPGAKGPTAKEPADSAVERQPAPTTAPLPRRQTEPLPASQPRHEATTKPTTGMDPRTGGQSKTNLIILVGLLMLGVFGLVVGATSYLRQQAQARTEQEQAQLKLQKEEQDRKEGRIEHLRGKIAEIDKRLQAVEKPALKEKRDIWNESLNRLRERLDEIGKMSSDQVPQISQACDEIGQELKKIEDEVNDLQGLMPMPLSNRQPVKI
ncbi:MAG: protein phosphatase 2C domain-containing protein [Blastocatellia bacterium]